MKKRTRLAEANDPTTSPTRLQELLQTADDLDVIASVVENPNVPFASLYPMTNPVVARVLQNPALTLHLLVDHNLFLHFCEQAQVYLAAATDDLSVIRVFLRSQYPFVVGSLLDNPHFPADLVTSLLSHVDGEVRAKATRHDLRDGHIYQLLHRLCDDGALQRYKPAAYAKFTDEEWETILAQGIWAKRLSAQHPRLPFYFLERLYDDADESVCASALQNVQLSMHFLADAAEDYRKNLTICRVIAQHRRTSTDTLWELLQAHPHDEYLWYNILNHQNVSQKIIDAGLQFSHESVRQAAKRAAQRFAQTQQAQTQPAQAQQTQAQHAQHAQTQPAENPVCPTPNQQNNQPNHDDQPKINPARKRISPPIRRLRPIN